MPGGSRRPTNPTTRVRRAASASGLASAVAALVVCGACSDVEPMTGGDVFRVEIEACAGVSHQRATALAVRADLVATAAHTLEAARGAVLRTVDGAELAAEIAYLDLDRDIALLAVDTTLQEVFDLAGAVDGDEVTIATWADPDGLEVKQATVLRSVTATLDGEGRRQAVELDASIELGDSGAPVVDGDGRAVGMVFASARREDRGWAVAAAELEAAINALAGDGYEPPDSRCRS